MRTSSPSESGHSVDCAAMIPELRRAYNAAYTDARHREYARRLAERGGNGDPVPPGRDAGLPAAGAPRRDGRGVARDLPPALDAGGALPVARRRAAGARRPGLRRASGLRRHRLRGHARRRRAARPEADRAPGLPDALRLPGRAVRGARAPVPGRREARLVSLGTRHGVLQARRRRGDPLGPASRRSRAPRPRSAAPEDRHRLRVHRAVLGREGARPVARSRSAAASSGTAATASRRASAGSTTGSSSTSSRRPARSSPST